MARPLEIIQQEIKTAVRTFPSLDNLKFPEEGGSNVGVFNVLIYTTAAAIYTFEVLLDVFRASVQAIADAAPSGNAKWVQRQILRFQFGDVVQLVDGAPTYVPIDESARIVTRASVKQLPSGLLAIKVAKGTPPSLGPLSGSELAALQDYWFGTSTTEGVGFAGVKTTFVNLQPDRMRVQATVYYLGQYIEADVKTNVTAAINNFFNTFQDVAFDGTIFMIKLIDAIQVVPGVSRVTLEDVKARPQATPLISAGSIDIQGFYETVAGYVISEDTADNTLDDTITMQPELL